MIEVIYVKCVLNFKEYKKTYLEYVMNGLVLHVGKNVNQIYSVKHIVNMFNDFNKFSYDIKNIHAIYDKKYEPEAIRLLLEN